MKNILIKYNKIPLFRQVFCSVFFMVIKNNDRERKRRKGERKRKNFGEKIQILLFRVDKVFPNVL